MAMEESNAPGPGLITLDVEEQFTYARTSIQTLQVIRFFLNELEPVNIEDIKPEDCNCHICTEAFTTVSHRAVRLPCNHIFGKACIEKWLRPYASLVVMEEDESRERALSLGANTCPLCRRAFFPRQTVVDNLTVIEMRIKYWDMAYEYVGIALSEHERGAREDLLRYLGSYPTHDLDMYYSFKIVGKQWAQFLDWCQTRLLVFSVRLKHGSLTPEQEYLRQRLQHVAGFGFPGGLRWWRNAQNELFFAVGCEDEERDESEDVDMMDAEQEGEAFADGDTEMTG